MARDDLTQVREELGRLGESLGNLTGARQGNNLPPQNNNRLMTDMHADVMDRLDGLEDGVAAVHDNTLGPRGDRETITRLQGELDYENGKSEDMRDAKRANDLARNHNNYTDSCEVTPFAQMRDLYNTPMPGFPRNLYELRHLDDHQVSLFLQDVGLHITGNQHTRLLRLADFIGVGHKLFTLDLKEAQNN